MDYPVKFLLPDKGFKEVLIQGDGFPDNTDLTLRYCSRKKSFSTTLFLPSGVYRYCFSVDGQMVSDPFRTCSGDAVLYLGGNHVLFDETKMFLDRNNLVIILNMDSTVWFNAVLNIQTLSGISSARGICFFSEGTRKYWKFVVPIGSQEEIYAYFVLESSAGLRFFGNNGIHDREWYAKPFLIFRSRIATIMHQDIVVIYKLDSEKNTRDFEKRHDYFGSFPADCIDAPLSDKSPLLRYMYPVPDFLKTHGDLAFLLREFFLEQENIIPISELMGRFLYENGSQILRLRFRLSDEDVSFWDVVRRNVPAAMRAIAFQFLCCGIPEILFGEEVGLAKKGKDRRMYWTKARWNKDLYHFYCKIIKLRKTYPVLRVGSIRFVVQDCRIWGVERLMEGEPSIFIFGNHSKENIVIDLVNFVSESSNIKELLTDQLLKHKKVCTIYAHSVAVYMAY